MPDTLAKAIKEARGDDSREKFCSVIGCGMTSLIRWEKGTTAPQSEAHKKALIRKGVPATLLATPANGKGEAAA